MYLHNELTYSPPQLHTLISISNNSLYEKNTWTDENSPCFDSIGGLSNKGEGDVYNTAVQPGSTCYSLFVQPSSTPFPTESPITEPESIGGNICTREPDYKCYKTGRPACCSDDEYTCPDYMTMCDNYPEDYAGTSYCSYAPEYGCDPATWSNSGWPKCCHEDGGDIMNCPIEQPACNPEDTIDFVARPVIRQKNSKNVAKSNVQATKNKNNAQSTKNTAKSDAQTTKNTAKSNADNTKNAYKNAYVPPQDEFAARGVVGRATSTAARATSDAASTATRATNQAAATANNAAATANNATKKASSTAWRTATGNPPQEETNESNFVAHNVVGRATSTAARATSDAASTAARATNQAAATANNAANNAAATATRATNRATRTAWRTATGNPPQEENDVSKVSYLRASRK